MRIAALLLCCACGSPTMPAHVSGTAPAESAGTAPRESESPAPSPAEATLAHTTEGADTAPCSEAAPPAAGSAWAIETNPSPSFDIPAAAVVVGADLYIAGYEGVGGPWRVERRRADSGALVSVDRSDPGTYWGVRSMIACGRALFVAGDTRVEKRTLPDAALVREFGDRGALPVTGQIHAIAADARAIYLIGETGGGLWVQKRDAVTGEPIASFADRGTWKARAGGGSAFLLTGAIAGDALFVGGFHAPGGQHGRIDRLDRTTGEPVAGFRTVTVRSDFGVVQRVERIAIASESLFAFVSDSNVGIDSQWHMQRRALRDGEPLWTRAFNPNPARAGARSTGARPRGVYDQTGDMAADDSGAVYVGTGAETYWLVVEMTEDGAIERIHERDPGPGRDEATAVAIDAAWIYVAGFVEVEGQDMKWRIERIRRHQPPNSVLVVPSDDG